MDKIETILKSLDKENIDYSYNKESKLLMIYAWGGWDDYDLSNPEIVETCYKEATEILNK